MIDFTLFRHLPAQPGGLHIEHAVEPQIIRMHVNRRVRGLLDAVQANDVIDMRVGDHDRADFQVMAVEDFEYSFRVIARIDHDSVARVRVADDVAIALQHAHGQNFVNQFCAVSGMDYQYSIGRLGI